MVQTDTDTEKAWKLKLYGSDNRSSSYWYTPFGNFDSLHDIIEPHNTKAILEEFMRLQ